MKLIMAMMIILMINMDMKKNMKNMKICMLPITVMMIPVIVMMMTLMQVWNSQMRNGMQ